MTAPVEEGTLADIENRKSKIKNCGLAIRLRPPSADFRPLNR
jgi:hypothetical protein